MIVALLSLGCAGSEAADFGDPRARVDDASRFGGGSRLVEVDPNEGPPPPRYFPREEGDSNPPRPVPVLRRVAACAPRRAPVPTNAPGDPSYVGSTHGLGKPSYYGLTPALGIDDPFGRSPLPYCP